MHNRQHTRTNTHTHSHTHTQTHTVSVPGSLACLSLVLQSLCDLFPPSGTLLDFSDWAFFVCWLRIFTVLGTKVTFFSLINVGRGFHCLRSLFFLDPSELGILPYQN